MISYNEAVKGLTGTLLDEKRLRVIYEYAQKIENIPGSIYECGVLKGGGSLFLRRIFPSRMLRLFDSFEGLPEACEHDNHLKKGDFGGGEWFAETAKRMGGETGFSIHKGWLPESFSGLSEQIAFVHLDVDLYSSYMNCLSFFKDRMPSGGVVVCDDYGHFNCLGAKKAVDEVVSAGGWTMVRPGTIQAVLIRN